MARARPITLAMRTTAAACLLVLAPVGSGSIAGHACATAAPMAGGQVRAGLVVDHGTVGGSAGRVDSYCVTVSDGATGFQVLQAAGVSVRVAPSGLVCALDGLPAPNDCGVQTSGGYRYWAYFTSTGSSWTYAAIGPATHRVHEGFVEGWHFVEGTGKPGDPPPRRDPAGVCTPVTTTSASTTPTPTASPPAPPPGPTAPGPAAPGQRSPDREAGGSGDGGSGGTGGSGAGAPGGDGVGQASQGLQPASIEGTPGSDQASGAETVAPRALDGSPVAGGDEGSASQAAGVAASPASVTAPGSAASPVPVAVAVGAIVVLASAAALRSRRDRES